MIHALFRFPMYSDPADDGYVQGDVYPGGPLSQRAQGAARECDEWGGGSEHPGIPENRECEADSLG